MTDLEGMKLIKILQSAYPRQEFKEDTIRVYTRMLADLPYAVAQQAVYELLATSRFLPTIAEIRTHAVEVACPVPSVDEAVIEARNIVRSSSVYDKQSTQWTHPAIGKAVLAMGGVETLGMSEEPEFVWAQFRKVYAEIRNREIERLQTKQGLLAEVVRQALPPAEVSAS